MTTIFGEEVVPAKTKTIITGVKCDVCGKEDSPPWGIPKGWYTVQAHSDYSTDSYYAHACGLDCLLAIARDPGRYIEGHPVRIMG